MRLCLAELQEGYKCVLKQIKGKSVDVQKEADFLLSLLFFCFCFEIRSD